jgi:hypothetical protein
MSTRRSERFARLLIRILLGGMLALTGCDDGCDCDEGGGQSCSSVHQCGVATPNLLCTYNIAFVEADGYEEGTCYVTHTRGLTIQVRGNPSGDTILPNCVNLISVTSKFTGTNVPCYP